MYDKITKKMEKIYNILNTFRFRYLKIYPYLDKNYGNRERSKTEYNYDDYQEILYEEYKRKKEYKQNKTHSILRIRGSSF